MASSSAPLDVQDRSSSSESELGDDVVVDDIFGHLINIDRARIVDLCSRVRQNVFNVTTSNGYHDVTFDGSFHLVHIVQLDHVKMAIRIPACGKHGSLDKDAQTWLRSHVLTLRFIKDNTTIPVSEVYDFDVTTNNEIGAPYIAMSYIRGTTVSDLWDDSNGPTPLEERRLRILGQLAWAMSQLNTHHFYQIGSLFPRHPHGYKIGQCYGWHKTENGRIMARGSGPFQSTLSLMESYWAATRGRGFLVQGTAKFLKMILALLPDQSSNFVLTPYDFDSQNVMADEMGNLTGILDWDNAQTMPSIMGCLKFPVWIQPDYDHDPANHDSSGNGQAGNRNGELSHYRAYYAEQMHAALVAQGRGADHRHTLNSHIFDAFWVAYYDTDSRTDICKALVQQVKEKLAGRPDPIPYNMCLNSELILSLIGRNMLDEEDLAALEKGLKAVMGLEE